MRSLEAHVNRLHHTRLNVLNVTLAHISSLKRTVDELELGFMRDFAVLTGEERNPNFIGLQRSKKWILLLKVLGNRNFMAIVPTSLGELHL